MENKGKWDFISNNFSHISENKSQNCEIQITFLIVLFYGRKKYSVM